MLLTQPYVCPQRTLNSRKLHIRRVNLKIFVLALFMYCVINTNKGRFSPFLFSRLKEYNFSIGMVWFGCW